MMFNLGKFLKEWMFIYLDEDEWVDWDEQKKNLVLFAWILGSFLAN